jgi:YidC/Oxa1 family membrane protein insertase
MEKRLFLAVFLSLFVVFGFQTFFGAKKQALNEAQPVVNEPVAAKTSVTAAVVTESPANNTPKMAVFAEKTAVIENSILKVSFNNAGGKASEIYLKAYDHGMPVADLPGFEDLAGVEFTLQPINDDTIRLAYQDETWQVIKEFSLNQDYTISEKIYLKNISKNAKSFSRKLTNLHIDTSRLDKVSVQSDWSLYEYSIKAKKEFIRKDNARNFDEKWNKEDSKKIDWVAFRDKYFVTLVSFEKEQEGYFIKTADKKDLFLGTTMAGVLEPGSETVLNYKIYAGPQRLDFLNKAGKTFEQVMVFSNWGWLDAISKGIYWLLGALHKIVPAWGLCIILISLIVYGLMYPLTVKSLVSMKKLQVLQPKMKELQEKYKNNPERLNKEVVELYRVNQVNPISGCVPMLLQMPIFVGLYQVLWRSVYFRGEGFLWIKDLSVADQTLKLPFTIPFLGEYLNILPIIMAIIMGAQQQLNMKSMSASTPDQASQQKMMAVFFPILIGFIFYNMASGLNLYFVVFYILSTASQWHISRTQA